MKISVTTRFKQAAKKLYAKQKAELEDAIKEIEKNPMVGELKVSDLAGIRVYKFHMFHQLILLAYCYDEEQDELILLSFASHENFYKDLKKQISN